MQKNAMTLRYPVFLGKSLNASNHHTVFTECLLSDVFSWTSLTSYFSHAARRCEPLRSLPPKSWEMSSVLLCIRAECDYRRGGLRRECGR